MHRLNCSVKIFSFIPSRLVFQQLTPKTQPEVLEVLSPSDNVKKEGVNPQKLVDVAQRKLDAREHPKLKLEEFQHYKSMVDENNEKLRAHAAGPGGPIASLSNDIVMTSLDVNLNMGIETHDSVIHSEGDNLVIIGHDYKVIIRPDSTWEKQPI